MCDESSFQKPLAAAMRHALAHVDGIRERPVDSTTFCGSESMFP
jgi:hypothetical protein